MEGRCVVLRWVKILVEVDLGISEMSVHSEKANSSEETTEDQKGGEREDVVINTSSHS